MPDTTLFNLSGDGVPQYSARGLTQTLAPIEGAAQIRRTINGSLVDLSRPEFQKYASTVSCTDQQPPAVVWPGAFVTVDCACELSYLTVGGAPQRAIVPGSSRNENGFTFYRPRLAMRVISGPTISLDEYGAAVSWTLNFEEI